MENDLEILITAVDEASDVFEAVGESLSALPDQAADSAAGVNEALDGINSDEVASAITTEVGGSLDSLPEIAADAVAGVTDALSSIGPDFLASGAPAEITAAFGAAFEGVVVGAADDGTAAAEAFLAAMNVVLAPGAAAAAAEVNSELSSAGVGSSGAMGGIGSLIAGGAALEGVKDVLSDAASQQEAVAAGAVLVGNTISSAGTAASGTGIEIAKLNAELKTAQAAYDTAAASTTNASGTTAEFEARQTAAAAKMDASTASIQKITAQLQPLEAQQNAVGQSASAVNAQLLTYAESQANLGFTTTDTITALSSFYAQTGTVQGAIDELTTAENLASQKHLDLGTATQQVSMAFSGAGRGLQQYGIYIKDNLTGSDALSAINSKLGGSAADAAQQGFGPLTVAMAKWSDTMSDIGTKDLPIIQSLGTWLGNIATDFDDLAKKSPGTAGGILAVAGAFGTFLAIAGGLTLIKVMILPGLEMLFEAAMAVIAPFIAVGAGITLLIIAIAAFVVLVIYYHQQIWDFIKKMWADVVAIWDGVQSNLKAGIDVVSGWFKTFGSNLKEGWETVWQGMADFLVGIWSGIKNAVKTGIDDVIAPINAFIGAIDSIHINIPAVSILGVKTPALNLGFSIPQIPMLADGGIVTGPTLAMIGEAGPEMVIPLSALGAASSPLPGATSGSGAINITVNGSFPTDTNSVRQIANLLAQQIQTQLKLKRVA